jgi:hypothetical protein
MGATKGSGDAPFAVYPYDPSMGGAILFVLLFMGTTGYHILQMFRSRI